MILVLPWDVNQYMLHDCSVLQTVRKRRAVLKGVYVTHAAGGGALKSLHLVMACTGIS